MLLNELNEINEYFRTTLYEMSNFSSDDTGLSDGIKLWVREEPNGLPHSKYRIKLIHPQNGSAVFAIWGDEAQQVAGKWEVKGKDLKKIIALTSMLSDSIRDHIDGNLSSLQLGLKLLDVKPDIEKI